MIYARLSYRYVYGTAMPPSHPHPDCIPWVVKGQVGRPRSISFTGGPPDPSNSFMIEPYCLGASTYFSERCIRVKNAFGLKKKRVWRGVHVLYPLRANPASFKKKHSYMLNKLFKKSKKRSNQNLYVFSTWVHRIVINIECAPELYDFGK